MFGFFKKRSSTAEQAEDLTSAALDNLTDAAFVDVKRKWIDFNETFIFKDEVPLSKVITAFAMPIQEFFENKYPVILQGPPRIFWLMIFTAILQSETHPKVEVNAAIEELQEKYTH